MKIYIDVDETICRTPPDRDYTAAEPMHKNINLANELYDEGHEIVYWTARGSVSGDDWRKLTKGQLDAWGCKYHALEMGKPSYDLFIDDKSLNARVWEEKGNNVARRVFLQSRAYIGIMSVASRQTPKLDAKIQPRNWPRGIGFSALEGNRFEEGSLRWVFQGEFPNDVNFPPCFAQLNNRPNLIPEKEQDEDGWSAVKSDSDELEPLKIHVFDVDAKGEFVNSLASVSSCIFDDEARKNGYCVGSCRLTLYNESGLPLETWVFNESRLQDLQFSSLMGDDPGDLWDVEITLEYNDAKYMQVKQ